MPKDSHVGIVQDVVRVGLRMVIVVIGLWMYRNLQSVEFFVILVDLKDLGCIQWSCVPTQWSVGCYGFDPVYSTVFSVGCVKCGVLAG